MLAFSQAARTRRRRRPKSITMQSTNTLAARKVAKNWPEDMDTKAQTRASSTIRTKDSKREASSEPTIRLRAATIRVTLTSSATKITKRSGNNLRTNTSTGKLCKTNRLLAVELVRLRDFRCQFFSLFLSFTSSHTDRTLIYLNTTHAANANDGKEAKRRELWGTNWTRLAQRNSTKANGSRLRPRNTANRTRPSTISIILAQVNGKRSQPLRRGRRRRRSRAPLISEPSLPGGSCAGLRLVRSSATIILILILCISCDNIIFATKIRKFCLIIMSSSSSLRLRLRERLGTQMSHLLRFCYICMQFVVVHKNSFESCPHFRCAFLRHSDFCMHRAHIYLSRRPTLTLTHLSRPIR